MSHITATFKTKRAAEEALGALENIGVTDEQIGLLVTDATRGSTLGIKTDDKTEEGFATGAATGGLIGGVWGALGTATTMAVPGLNVVMTGVWISILAGIGAGAASGGLIGGLVGSGMNEHEAVVLENDVKEGGILLAINPKDNDQREEIKHILEKEDAYNLAA